MREGIKLGGVLFEPVMVIGGQGGTEFGYYGGTDGRLLERIKVWAGGWQIKAIEVKLTGEVARIFGEPGSCPSQEFVFQPGERVRQMSLWGNGAGTRVGWIYFRTNHDHRVSWPRGRSGYRGTVCPRPSGGFAGAADPGVHRRPRSPGAPWVAGFARSRAPRERRRATGAAFRSAEQSRSRAGRRTGC